MKKCDDGNRTDGDGCDAYCRKERQPAQKIEFPTEPTVQPLAPKLPLASLIPLMQQRAPAGDTGPAAVAVIAAGAAAGIGFIRKRKKP